MSNGDDGNPTSPREWFEGREGFVSGLTEGGAYAVPFVLDGTMVPTPTGVLIGLCGISTRVPRSRRPQR